MKNKYLKSLLIIAAFLLLSIVNAQEPYFCTEKGAKLEYIITNSSGEIQGYQMFEILDIQKGIEDSDTLTTITYSVNALDTDRKSEVEFPIKMTVCFDNDALRINMAESIVSMLKTVLEAEMKKDNGDEIEEGEVEETADMINDMIKISGDTMILPSNMKPGDQLPDSYVSVKVLFMSSKMSITEREVLREETITTDAGIYPCMVVKEKMIGKGMGLNSKTTAISWYSRGEGVIRTETYDKKGKLETVEVLSSKSF